MIVGGANFKISIVSNPVGVMGGTGGIRTVRLASRAAFIVLISCILSVSFMFSSFG